MQGREVFPPSHGNPTPSPEMCGVLPTLSKQQVVNWSSLGGKSSWWEHPCPQDALGGPCIPAPPSAGDQEPRGAGREGSILPFGLGLEEPLLQDCACSCFVSADRWCRQRSLWARLAHPAVSGTFFQTFSLHFYFLNFILNVLCLSPRGSK